MVRIQWPTSALQCMPSSWLQWFNLQWFNQCTDSKWQQDAKGWTAFHSIQCHITFQCSSSPTVVHIEPVKCSQCFYSAGLVNEVGGQLVDSGTCQESVQWRVIPQYNHLLVQLSADTSPVHLQCSQQCASWGEPAVQLSIREQWHWNHTSFHNLTCSAQWAWETHSLCSLCSGNYISFEQCASEDFYSLLCGLGVTIVLSMSVTVVWHLHGSPVQTVRHPCYLGPVWQVTIQCSQQCSSIPRSWSSQQWLLELSSTNRSLQTLQVLAVLLKSDSVGVNVSKLSWFTRSVLAISSV